MITIREGINYLKRKGYTEDFNNALVRNKYSKEDFQDHFKIDEIVRIDTLTDPEDQSIIYAISSENDKVKGHIIDGFGRASDPEIAEFMKGIRREH